MSRHVPKIVWETLDWRATDEQLSRMLVISVSAVRRQRLLRAPETRKRIRAAWRLDWSKADWSKDNRSIADDLGCLMITVRRKRLELKRNSGSSTSQNKRD